MYIDTYTSVVDVKLYEDKTTLTAADILNGSILPWYEEQGVPVLRILPDRGTAYKGKLENHAYQLFLSIAVIEHSTTKAYSPQTNGICERFNKTMRHEFFEVAMRKKKYSSVGELQRDLDIGLHYYNHERAHAGKFCYGKTPMQTFAASKKHALEKSNENLYLEPLSESQKLSDNMIS